MSVKPLISTITLAYNVGKYLNESISSIQKQSYENLEIIMVINGKSKDETDEIALSLAAADNRIKLVYNHKNSIIGEGRMIGLNTVTGDYFTFLDGDDFLASDAIDNLYYTITEKQADISIGYIQRVYVNGEINQGVRGGGGGGFEYDTLTPEEYIPDCLLYIDTLLHGKLYSTKLYKENNIHMFNDSSLGEDKLLHLQFVAYAKKITQTHKIVHYFRLNPNSMTNKLRYKDFWGEFRNMLWIEKLYEEKGYLSHLRCLESFKAHQLYLLYYCFFTGYLKIFKSLPQEASELLYGDFIMIKSIRNYLKQWKFYVPILETYRFNRYLGVFICFIMNNSRIVLRKIKKFAQNNFSTNS